MIAIGDIVTMRQPDQARQTDNVTYTVTVIPVQVNNGPTWWEMIGTEDGKTYVFHMLTVFTYVTP